MKDATFDALNEGQAAKEALMEMRDRLAVKDAEIDRLAIIRAETVKGLTGDAVKTALLELQAYVDERARGLSVPGRGHYSEIERRAAMKEAMEIGMRIASLIKRGQG